MKKKNIPVIYEDTAPEVVSFRLDYEDLKQDAEDIIEK